MSKRCNLFIMAAVLALFLAGCSSGGSSDAKADNDNEAAVENETNAEESDGFATDGDLANTEAESVEIETADEESEPADGDLSAEEVESVETEIIMEDEAEEAVEIAEEVEPSQDEEITAEDEEIAETETTEATDGDETAEDDADEAEGEMECVPVPSACVPECDGAWAVNCTVINDEFGCPALSFTREDCGATACVVDYDKNKAECYVYADGDEAEEEPQPEEETEKEEAFIPEEWLDPSTNYTWLNNPIPASMTFQGASDFCASLGGTWRLPKIDELRTLIRGCDKTVTNGPCQISDNCLYDSCWDANCRGCDTGGGPGENGCYWPVGMKGACTWYWSTSLYADLEGYAYYVGFYSADLNETRMDMNSKLARCIK